MCQLLPTCVNVSRVDVLLISVVASVVAVYIVHVLHTRVWTDVMYVALGLGLSANSLLCVPVQVRGAPAIAMVGALSVAVELGREDNTFEAVQGLREFVEQKFDYLKTARPTAVNLERAKTEVLSFLDEQTKSVPGVAALKSTVIGHIGDMLSKDRQDNESIGRHGATAILKTFDGGNAKDTNGCQSDGLGDDEGDTRSDGLGDDEGDTRGDSGGDSVVKRKISVLTHCNTGSLATAGYGTALGVIRRLHELGQLKMAYCTETRPYNQGSRLTAYELVVEGIPGTLITDSMAAAAMQSKAISAVIVGADRVVKNGDVANKIGTLQLAVAAAHFKVPFYVAAPTTSFDLGTESGGEIVIEERPEHELVAVNGMRIAAPGIGTWNPAFDVTPGKLITGGIITENGVVMPEEVAKLKL